MTILFHIPSERGTKSVPTVTLGYMIRTINVKRCPELMKKTEDCDFTVTVFDDMIEENNRTFRVTIRKNEPMLRKVFTEKYIFVGEAY